jgi:hypothetical protein
MAAEAAVEVAEAATEVEEEVAEGETVSNSSEQVVMMVNGL